MQKTLPSEAELAPYCRDPAGLITPRVLQRAIALRRQGLNWLTICAGGLDVPSSHLKAAYSILPEHLK